MASHKLQLTESETNLIRWATGKLLRSLENDMQPWLDFDEKPPEYLLEQLQEVAHLYNKLCKRSKKIGGSLPAAQLNAQYRKDS